MKLEDFVASRILEAPLVDFPWPHLVIRDFLPEEVYQEFLEKVRKENFEFEPGETRASEFVDPSYSPVVGAVESRAVIKTLETKLQIRSGSYPWPRLTLDTYNHTYPVHPDGSGKAGTLQLYLTPEEIGGYGTRLHTRNTGNPFGGLEIPYAPNTAFAFKRTDSSWHSVGLVGRKPRWSLLTPYYWDRDRRLEI